MNTTQAPNIRDVIEQFVFDELRRKLGPTAVKTRLVDGFADPKQVPVDPLVAAGEAARLAERMHGLAADYASQARGRGSSWHDIAVALDANHEASAAVTAFRRLASRSTEGSFGPAETAWRCQLCSNWIVDYGPAFGRIDLEDGHAHDCARRRVPPAA